MDGKQLDEAYAHFNAGRLEDADTSLQFVLVDAPENAEAWHLLGIVRFRQGRVDEACELLQRATDLTGATPEMQNNLGAVLNAAGRQDAAMAAFERALAQRPNYADALNNLGVTYRDQRKFDAAVAAFRRAIELRPDYAQAKANLRSAYHDVVPAWHFAMMDDQKRNAAFEAAIRRAVRGKHVLDVGTGAGLLAMMAARAGAAQVTSCETIGIVAERAREIIAANGLKDRITVVAKPSSELIMGVDLKQPAEVLITETLASGVVGEGILQILEHAHANLLAPGAVVIPQAASVMGYLAGGARLSGLLFADRVAGFDLSAFNDFAPARLPVSLNGVPHHAMSADTEFARFDFRQRQFPMGDVPAGVEATLSGPCAGVLQWMRLELDGETRYENRPTLEMEFCGHWTHMLHRFPRMMAVRAGEFVPVMFHHDRSQVSLTLIE
jgi:cytochrome c-type biogenesis protein CcmH/NrfG